ncbi:Mdm33 family-domain-containing protein [Infundibulicybe gibba]|nr:Mdm33 family-domain-containing protein [Infundibulicybe gibba]
MLRSSLSRPLAFRQAFRPHKAWNSTFKPPPEGAPATGQALHDSETTPSHSPPPTFSDDSKQPTQSSLSSQADSNPPTPTGQATYNAEMMKQRLREWSDRAAITFRTRADEFTANTKKTFSQLGSQLNQVTGYEEIEALKREVVLQEAKITAAREAAREAKIKYEEAVIQRSNSQREVNELLQRKSLWNDDDVGRFTKLVRQDHLFEQGEARAKVTVGEAEDAVEREFSQLMRSILARYHEEQVWSDKIRSASTYGSLAALGLNLLVFIMAIVVVEPWKRRRLAQTFEKKIEELSVENATALDLSMKEIIQRLSNQEENLLTMKAGVAQTPDIEVEVTKARPVNEPVDIPTVIPQPTGIILQTRELELAIVASGAFVVGLLGHLVWS